MPREERWKGHSNAPTSHFEAGLVNLLPQGMIWDLDIAIVKAEKSRRVHLGLVIKGALKYTR